MSTNLTCCPFCGLVCDDVHIIKDDNGLHVSAAGCPRATNLFVVPNQGQAMVEGRPVSIEEAYRVAGMILKNTHRPLIGGLSCDVGGQRAALACAEKLGGIVDHMNGDAQFHNWLAFQDGGWITTTLSEIRNRADLIVLCGASLSQFPRFVERCIGTGSQFGKLNRKLIVLSEDVSAELLSKCDSNIFIPIKSHQLGELFLAIQARINGSKLKARTIAGISIQQVEALIEDFLDAKYGVMVWNTAELEVPNVDMIVQTMVDVIKSLNKTTRWSGLPLGGNDGDTSAAQVCTWQTGYPLRTAFESTGPHYEPITFSTKRLLENDEVDALVWISAFDPRRVPPKAGCPTIVLGRADMNFDNYPDVFIPVGVPGIHHGGFLHRMDTVVVLPLQTHVSSTLDSVSDALCKIQRNINHAVS